MALYTLSEFLNVILDDIGLMDLPIIEKLGTENLLNRLKNSALKEFSTRYPYFYEWDFNDNELVVPADQVTNTTTGVKYEIPRYVYEDNTIIGVSHVDAIGSSGFNDMYMPNVYSFAADQVLTTIADVQMAATIGRSMSKSLSWEFIMPNQIKLYNGWLNGNYKAKLMLCHDESLSTIPATAMTNFRELATYDLEEYIYNKYKRIQSLDVGIGTIELKIDDWQDAGQKKRDLLKQWDEEGGNLDVDFIQYI